MDKIFEPFFTTKQQGAGTGLGMTTVYNMVKNHHGIINVYSELGKGTVFHISLPCSQETKKEKTNLSVNFTKCSWKILLVDDEKTILISMQKMLENLGIEVVTASNGKSALSIYKKNYKSFNLVITDMIMPEMNGRDLFLKMKKFNPECRVVMTSGFTKDANINELKKMGLVEFLQKPFLLSDLKNMLERLMRNV